MYKDKTQRSRIFQILLVSISLLLTISVGYSISSKKHIPCCDDTTELIADFDIDDDSDLFTFSFTPQEYSVSSSISEEGSLTLFNTEHGLHTQSEGRLYILFRQLRVHLV